MQTPNHGHVDALHRWQQRLERATSLDHDRFSHPVDLDILAQVAAELGAFADKKPVCVGPRSCQSGGHNKLINKRPKWVAGERL